MVRHVRAGRNAHANLDKLHAELMRIMGEPNFRRTISSRGRQSGAADAGGVRQVHRRQSRLRGAGRQGNGIQPQ